MHKYKYKHTKRRILQSVTLHGSISHEDQKLHFGIFIRIIYQKPQRTQATWYRSCKCLPHIEKLMASWSHLIWQSLYTIVKQSLFKMPTTHAFSFLRSLQIGKHENLVSITAKCSVLSTRQVPQNHVTGNKSLVHY